MPSSSLLIVVFLVTIIESSTSISNGRSRLTPMVYYVSDGMQNPCTEFFDEKLAIPKSEYPIERDQQITLRCLDTSPTKWMIFKQVDKIKEYVKIDKNRQTCSNGSNLFISDLTLRVPTSTKDQDPIVSNFSCSYVAASQKEDAKQLVTCALFRNDDEKATLSIKHSFSKKSCSFINDNFVEPDKVCYNLTVDLTKMAATCQKNKTPSGLDCQDLDTCESLLLDENGTAQQNRVCTEVFGEINDENAFSSSINLQNETLPSIQYCPSQFDHFWPSFGLLLYPGFLKGNWKKRKYYESMNASLDGNSIIIYAHTQGDSIESDPMSTRQHFAENEEVEVTCVAIKSLYMKGFVLSVDYNDEDQTVGKKSFILHNNVTYDLDNRTNLHLVKKNLTLTPNVSSISCCGPIWNSDNFTVATLDITLSPSKIPTVHLKIAVRNSSEFELNCSYYGWPRPTVIWRFPEEMEPSEIKGHMPLDDNYSQEPSKGWYQIRVFKKPMNSFNVTCVVSNMLANITSDPVTIEGENDKGHGILIFVIITCSFLICILIAILAVLYWRYRKKEQALNAHELLTMAEINEFYSGGSTTYEPLLLPYNCDYEIPMEQLVIEDAILGSGQFGLVLKGRIGPLTVAVKTIKPSADVIYFKSLLSELKILQYVGRHRNIVNLIGANTTNIKKREVFLVLDYCSNGNLVNFLRQCRERFSDFLSTSVENEEKPWPIYENSYNVTLTTGNLIVFAREIASAMNHLNSKNVIHGDLAARNVLVTEDLHAKICDFGLSKQLLHYSVYVQKIDCPLPLRWMALESLQDMEFSLASDKWSYGVCMWEIFSLGELPYSGVQWSFESYKLLQEGYRMEKPKFANESIYSLMLKCWNAQPQERPSFQYIIGELQAEEELLT